MKSPLAFLLLSAALAPLTAIHAQDLANQFPVQAPATGKAGAKKSSGSPQAKVAAKAKFPTVAAASIKGAKSAADLAGAKNLVGKTVTFVGTVDRVFAPKSNSVVLLNFAKDYKTALVGAVSAKNFRVFPDLNQLKGKKVTLTGKVVLHKGAPEVELEKVGAIKIVK